MLQKGHTVTFLFLLFCPVNFPYRHDGFAKSPISAFQLLYQEVHSLPWNILGNRLISGFFAIAEDVIINIKIHAGIFIEANMSIKRYISKACSIVTPKRPSGSRNNLRHLEAWF